MIREMTCIMCPSGCDLEAEVLEGDNIEVRGNLCPKGKDYACQEIIHPMRNIATSIRIRGGELPLASVRLDQLIPKDKIFAVMKEIKAVKMNAPVHIGEVVLANVADTGSNVVITKNVKSR